MPDLPPPCRSPPAGYPSDSDRIRGCQEGGDGHGTKLRQGSANTDGRGVCYVRLSALNRGYLHIANALQKKLSNWNTLQNKRFKSFRATLLGNFGFLKIKNACSSKSFCAYRTAWRPLARRCSTGTARCASDQPKLSKRRRRT